MEALVKTLDYLEEITSVLKMKLKEDSSIESQIEVAEQLQKLGIMLDSEGESIYALLHNPKFKSKEPTDSLSYMSTQPIEKQDLLWDTQYILGNRLYGFESKDKELMKYHIISLVLNGRLNINPPSMDSDVLDFQMEFLNMMTAREVKQSNGIKSMGSENLNKIFVEYTNTLSSDIVETIDIGGKNYSDLKVFKLLAEELKLDFPNVDGDIVQGILFELRTQIKELYSKLSLRRIPIETFEKINSIIIFTDKIDIGNIVSKHVTKRNEKLFQYSLNEVIEVIKNYKSLKSQYLEEMVNYANFK